MNHAFPIHIPKYQAGHIQRGLTKIEMACIELRIQRTGDQDLDALIREAQRRDVAAMAMQGILSGLPKEAVYSPTITANASVCYADALLAELAKQQEVAK